MPSLPAHNSTEITRHRVGCYHPPSFSSCTHTAMQYMRSLPIKSYIHTELSVLLGWVELCQHLMNKQFSLSQTNFNAAKFNMNHRQTALKISFLSTRSPKSSSSVKLYPYQAFGFHLFMAIDVS